MKWSIFLTAFLLICLIGCKSHRTDEFRQAIIQKERVAFNIVLGKNGSEAQKLKCLVQNDFKGALAWVNRQAGEFDKLIKGIESLPAGGIIQGDALKKAAVGYYAALKELHFFDRKEIEQSEAIHQLKGDEQRAAQQKLIELARQKKALYENVYEQERRFSEALHKFNSANDL